MTVSLYTVRVVYNVLTEQDYGLYGAVGGIILTFSFISSVLDNASQRFFSFELGKGKEGHLQEAFSTLYIIYLIVSVFIIIVAETLGLWFLENKMTIPAGREVASFWVFQFALASFIVTIISTPYRSMIIAQEKMNLYAYLSIFDAIAKLIIAYLLIVFDCDKLILYAILLFIISLIDNLFYLFYCKRKFEDSRIVLQFDKKTFNSVLSYSSWTLFGTLASMCNTQGVNIVLNLFYGPIANAAYSVASQIYHTVGSFANNFYVAVKPPLIKSYASNDYHYVIKLFTFSSKSLFTLLCVIAIPIMVCIQDILRLWLGHVGDFMEVFAKLSLVYVIILTISYPITAVVQAGGNVKEYHSKVDGFSLLVLPIVYVLFKYGFGAHWAYIVSIVIFSIAHFLRIIVMKKVFPIFDIREYVMRVIIPMIVVFIFTYFPMALFKTWLPNRIWYTLACFVSTALLELFLCALLLFTKEEIQMVLSFVKGWKNNRII